MRPLKYFLNFLARPVRRACCKAIDYFAQLVAHKVTERFVDVARMELIQQFSSMHAQVVKELQELKELKAILSLGCVGRPKDRGPNSVVSAAHLYDIFSTVNLYYRDWSTCDVILTCPLLQIGAELIFPDKKIFVIKHPNQIFDALNFGQIKTLGVVSPWLVDELMSDDYAPCFISMNCLDRVVLIAPNIISRDIELRKVMHTVGFYEVARSTSSGLDDISIGCLPDGRFRLFGSEPGLSHGLDNFSNYVAFRIPHSDPYGQTWHNVSFDTIRSYALGYGVDASGFGLAITTIPSEDTSELSEIRASMRWAASGEGHASLVGCYGGPSDSHMYACLFQVLHEPVVSLWVNNGLVWKQLDAHRVPDEKIDQGDGFREVSIWFRVYQTKLAIGVANTTFIEQTSSDLERVPVFGLRISGDSIRVAKVSINNRAHGYA